MLPNLGQIENKSFLQFSSKDFYQEGKYDHFFNQGIKTIIHRSFICTTFKMRMENVDGQKRGKEETQTNKETNNNIN